MGREQAVAAAGFVGRRRDLAAAEAAIASALSGRGALVLLSGEAGIGKTRLAEKLAERVEADGALVLWGTCWEMPGAPSLWPWAQALRAYARAQGPEAVAADAAQGVADLARLLPEATGTSPVSPDDAGLPDQVRFRMFDSVATFFANAARRRPLLIVLDDLQWADTPSLLLLRFLAHELRTSPVAVLANYRYPDLDPQRALAELLPDLARASPALSLYGLAAGETNQLLDTMIGAEPDPALVSAVYEHTGGNPLFVREIARLLLDRGRTDPLAPLLVPRTVQVVIARRLAYLSDACAQVLAQASVSGMEFSPEILKRATGAKLDPLRDLFEEAERAGIVTKVPGSSIRFAFTHALIRDVLYEGLPPARRRTLHHRTGQAIEEHHHDDLSPHLGELAHHFLLAGEDGDLGKALDYAQRAGRQALATLAYEEATEHCARALDLMARQGAGEEQRSEGLLALGDARMRAGDRQGAVEAYEEAAASARRRGDAAGLARAALGLDAGLGGFEVRLFDQEQTDLLREAARALGPQDSALKAWVLARLSVALSFLTGERERIALAEQAIEVARRLSDPASLAYALSAHCDALAGPGELERRLSEAREIVRLAQLASDLETELLGRRFLIVALLEAGDVTAADAQIDAFARTADRLRLPLHLWYVPLWRATRTLMNGQLAEAEQWARQAFVIGERGHSQNAEILVRAQHITLLVEQGRAAEACAVCAEHFPTAEFPSASGWMAGLLAAAGRRVEATALLDRLAASDFAEIPEDSEWIPALCRAAEGCAAVGHGKASAVLYERLSPHADHFVVDGIGCACMGSVSLFLGQLASLLGRHDAADHHFGRALEQHRHAGAPLLVAHTLRNRAAALTLRGTPEQATVQAMLREALAIYRELSLDHWTRVTEQMLATEPASQMVEPAASVFRLDGDYWHLAFGGASVRLKDAKGLHDIARLLADPNREFHVLDLFAGGTRPTTPRDARSENRTGEGDAGELLDVQARSAYRRRLTDLKDEIADAESAADPARAEKARDERDALVAGLAAAYGLSGRPRRMDDPAERARSAVTQRIRAALDRIDEHHPTLGRHLHNSVKTGTYCSYCPEQPMTWVLRPESG